MNQLPQPAAHGHLRLAPMAELLMAARGSDAMNQALRHLLAWCPACRRGHDALRRLCREARHPDVPIVLTEVRGTRALWRRLAPQPYPDQLSAVEEDETFQTWGLCRLLQLMSAEIAGSDAETASQLANLAVRIPPTLEPVYHVDSIRDLDALSFAYLGNAWRSLGDLHSPADAFYAAHRLRLAGTGDPAVAAEILALEALLLRDTGELPGAIDLLDRAEATYSGGSGAGAESTHLGGPATAGAHADDLPAGDPERAAAVRLHKAWCVYHLGRIAQAGELLDQAAGVLTERRHPRFSLALSSGLAWCALSLSSPDAEARLAQAIQLAERVGDAADRLRLRQAEAHLAFANRERGLAERTLRQVFLGFLELDLGLDASLAMLDLAALYLREGGADDEIRQLAIDLLPVFASREVCREAICQLLLFQEACQQEDKLTTGLVAGLVSLLGRTRRPSLAWWSGAGTALHREDAADADGHALG